MRDLDLNIDGAALHAGAALSILPELEKILTSLPVGEPGVRLHNTPGLAELLSSGAAYTIAADPLGAAVRPVRAILFDKSPTANWSLGWHQDRTIAVRERRDVPGFGPWSRKSGLVHVEPPFAIIESMVTLRIHLDDVPEDNAPLLIVRASHRLGRIAIREVEATAARLASYACLARRGDIWAYSTPIVHASQSAYGHRHRRVLQVDYSADALPADLLGKASDAS